MRFITPAHFGLMSALCLVAAAVLAFSDEALAATSPCEDPAPLQRRLDDFDARWNASDAWGLTAQFATDGSAAAANDLGRVSVYREFVERLGRTPQPRKTRLLRATPVGQACLVDVEVKTADRTEPGLFLLAPTQAGGILAMR